MADEKFTNVDHLKQVMQRVDDDFIDNEEFEAALTEAQQSGEFDGVGIASIEQTTTSSADGGTNVITITLTDGTKKTFTVKNGNKGSTGATGADGADGVSVTKVEQTTTSSADGGSNVITVTLSNGDTFTFTVKNGSKGSTGATGTRGSQIYSGTAITGTSTTATIFSSSGISAARVNDIYINTSTWNYYQCTVAGAASAAKWVYKGCLKGATGNPGATGTAATIEVGTVTTGAAGSNAAVTNAGTSAAAKFNFTIPRGATGETGTRGSLIYWGTAITGTSTTAKAFSSSGISSALVNDLYLNTSTYNIYQCTTAGAASVAKWKYVGNIKGGTGSTGPQGVSVTKVEQTTTSAADGGNNVITVTLSDGQTFTFNVKNGSKGSTGSDGSDGAAATISIGTVTTGAAGSNASVTNAGTSSAAKLNFTIPRGATGTRGSMFYWGTAITGTSTTAAVFSGSGISSALVNDLYLNTSTWNVYQCTTAGAASAAKWKYVGNIKGPQGPSGSSSSATVKTGTIPTSGWTENEDTGVKSCNVAISGITASHTATVDHSSASIDGTADGYATFVEEENQYLEFITNGYAETYAGGIRFYVFGDTPTVSIPIIVEVV